MSLSRIACIVFLSGFCSLVYQVMWLRSLRLVFGSSTSATSVVLAIFMGGLGLGGWYFGRRVERSPRPLAFYARLELGIALSAAASLLLVPLARELYLAVGGSSVLGLTGATAVRLLLAVVVLGVPTTLMGGTLPAVAQALERRSDVGRRIVATLYGVNTLGAVVGAFASTFFLLELFGVSRSILLAVLSNLLLALVLRAWARQIYDGSRDDIIEGANGAELPVPVTEPVSSPAGPAHGASAGQAALPRGLLFAVAGLVGFLFFLMEIVWYRMLAPLLGGSSYTFGLILTLALAGIGLGGWLYSLGPPERRPTLHALAASLSLEALFLALPLALGDRFAFLVGVLRDLQAGGFWALVLSWTLVGGLAVFPAALVAGYQFPLLVGLLGRGRDHVGSEVGRAYAWNTWGAVLGSLLGGLVFLPTLGAVVLWRASVAALVVASLVVWALFVRDSQDSGGRRGWLTVATVVCALLTLFMSAAQGPTAFWRHQPWGAGRADVSAVDPNELRRSMHDVRRALLAEDDGVESSVALSSGDELALVVNGKADGSARSDAPMQVMGGLIGAAIHPQPRNVLVVGLGTGMTAGWLAATPEVERVDLVELEPAVVRFSDAFRHAHLGVLESPKVHLHIGDGREWIRTTQRRYDIIFSEPSNPYRAGVPDLFSREFYAAVADRLEPGGIFIHWLQGYEVDAEVVRTVYSTILSVFPHVESWQPHTSDLLLLASRQPRELDFDLVRRRVEGEPFRSAMQGVWRVSGEAGLFSAYLGGAELARALATRTDRVSTDDRPLLEFAFARNLGRGGLFRVGDLQRLAAELMVEHPNGRGTPPSWRDVEELRGVRAAAGSLIVGDAVRGREGFEARQDARHAFRAGRWQAAAGSWSRQDEAPRTLYDRFLVAAAATAVDAPGDDGRDGTTPGADTPDPEEMIEALLADRPAERALLRARVLHERGEAMAAARSLLSALVDARSEPFLQRTIFGETLKITADIADALAASGESGASARAQELFDALGEELPARLFRQRRQFARLEIAYTLPVEERNRLCVEAFADFEPWIPWRETFLQQRLDCYRAADSPRARDAEADLERYLARAPAQLSVERGDRDILVDHTDEPSEP